MKAYVLHGIGDLRCEDCPMPELRPGWALIKVSAAGICSSDIPRIFEKGTYHFPTIPGHEFCGVVERTANPEDSGWVGRRVGVFPLIPCMACPSCARGEYETCSNYDYVGSRRDGGFAEYAAAPVWNLIQLPGEISDVQGALLEPAAVALHAVRRADIRPHSSVCVVGTGGIGLLAGQWARRCGADRVVIKGRSCEKEALARRCGLDYTGVTPEERFDRVIEAVGSSAALEESLTLAAPGGRVVLMGNPDGSKTLAQNVYWQILRKQLTLSGTWNSSHGGVDSDWEASVRAIAQGALGVEKIVTHIVDKDDLPQALHMMRSRTGPFCKIVVKF
ncbi:galactitol-1-phosphate 5-dehydrogenase [Oscillibacter sp.]|uniref:galactitol-1-phosphate 5-dehydrogenase n=1 Tax=Oscillibacter sp. TaxID=1945593 RepID=UPI0021729B9C|nr:galactitol-1-phosphate 5-dehydrogenase [Oscillibacter sp.]MCI9649537.1 galactitol-1-phosphate 5-dehydrogenase [Oscillibacter sp.]